MSTDDEVWRHYARADLLARLNADGTLDPTFNLTVDDLVSSMAKQADGKILIGGKFSSSGNA